MTIFDDRTELEVLRRLPSLRLLRTVKVGRVAFLDVGRVTILPVNFAVDGQRIVLRSDPGAKLDAATEGQEVAFEADGLDEEQRLGWDVLVRGRASEITDPAEIDRLAHLGVFPWTRSHLSRWIQIPLDDVSGRRTVRAYEPQKS